MARRKAAGPTYTATLSDGQVCYRHEPDGNLWGNLPIGASPQSWGSNEDPWDGAVFALRSGRTVTVRRDA